MRSYLALAGKLAAAYLLFSILWIFLSDSLLSFLFSDAEQIALLQTSKGLLFVVLSSIAIGGLALTLGERQERVGREADGIVADRHDRKPLDRVLEAER